MRRASAHTWRVRDLIKGVDIQEEEAVSSFGKSTVVGSCLKLEIMNFIIFTLIQFYEKT
jgi:hypothetical protein